MNTLISNFPILINPVYNRTGVFRSGEIKSQTLEFQVSKIGTRFSKIPRNVSYSNAQSDGSDDSQNSVQELRVPSHWLEPSKAIEESEWLRVTLKKWLDDEYCPEATNVEISNIAADSFYKSMLEKRVDLGDILLKMALELESISYQESFHGAFSSANAAVNLIIERISKE